MTGKHPIQTLTGSRRGGVDLQQQWCERGISTPSDWPGSCRAPSVSPGPGQGSTPQVALWFPDARVFQCMAYIFVPVTQEHNATPHALTLTVGLAIQLWTYEVLAGL